MSNFKILMISHVIFVAVMMILSIYFNVNFVNTHIVTHIAIQDWTIVNNLHKKFGTVQVVNNYWDKGMKMANLINKEDNMKFMKDNNKGRPNKITINSMGKIITTKNKTKVTIIITDGDDEQKWYELLVYLN